MTMVSNQLEFKIIDAFSSEPFGGNPAAVVLLDGKSGPRSLSDELMQKVATEMNLSETAFITHDSKNPETYGLRWFTPGAEVNLCGHATIASAAFLSAHPDHENHPEYKFQTRSGELIAKKIQEGGKEIFELDFPAYVPKEIKSEVWQSDKKCSNSFEKALMSDAVGRDVGSGRVLSIKGVYEGGEDLIILIERSEHDPMEEWEVIPEGFSDLQYRGICLTTRLPDSGDPNAPLFHSRSFFPNLGVPEDPVCGSLHCALAPLFSEMLEKNGKVMVAKHGGRRQGDVRCMYDNKRNRIMLAGEATIVSWGTMRYA